MPKGYVPFKSVELTEGMLKDDGHLKGGEGRGNGSLIIFGCVSKHCLCKEGKLQLSQFASDFAVRPGSGCITGALNPPP